MTDAPDLSALGTLAVVVLYACMWLNAYDDADAWVYTIDLKTVSASQIALKVVTVLLSSWLWLILFIVLIILIQKYALVYMRGKTPVHATAFQITFGPLGHASVFVSMLGAVAAAAIFSFFYACRALAHKSKAKASPVVTKDVHTIVSRSLLFNLAVVVTTLVLTYVFTVPREAMSSVVSRNPRSQSRD